MKDNSNTTLVLGLIVIIAIVVFIIFASDNQLFGKLKSGGIRLNTGQDATHSTTTDEQWERAVEQEKQMQKEENTISQ